MGKMQIMVLGCNGQVGHELVKQLGEEVVPKPREVLDITNYKMVNELIPHVRPNVIINCAAITSPTVCDRNRVKSWRVNSDAVDNLVKICAITGTPLIQLSCDQVFGMDKFRREPYSDTDPAGPVNTYGMSKLAAECALLRLGQCMCPDYWKAGFRYWIVRTSMLYERPWRQSANWIYNMMQHGVYRRTTPLSLPHDIIRTPTFVPHFVKALIWLAKHHREVVSGVYHIASAGEASIYEIGSVLSSVSKHGIEISMTNNEGFARTHGRDPETLPQYTALESSKFNDISPIILPDWQEGIEEFAMSWEEEQ